MPAHLMTTSAPLSGIHRIARAPADPFAMPDWDRVNDDGTFGNRFDDPGKVLGIPREQHYRVIYAATQRQAAFGETMARFRLRPGLASLLSDIVDDEESVEEALFGAVDPEYPDHSLLETDWIQRRRIGHTCISPEAQFVDIANSDTLAHLDAQIGVLAKRLGIGEIDLSAITSSSRRLTQYVSRYIFEQGYAGIRYTSRLGEDWECWAVFEGRFQHQMGCPAFPQGLAADDPDLWQVARKFGITMEVVRGMGHYLRPWQDSGIQGMTK